MGSIATFLYQSTLHLCLLTTKGFSISFPAAGTFTDTLLGEKMEKWEELSHSEFTFIEVNFQEGRLWTIHWSLLIFVELCEHEGLSARCYSSQRPQMTRHYPAESQCASDRSTTSEVWLWLIVFNIFLQRVKCFKEFCGRTVRKWLQQFLFSTPKTMLVLK